VFSMKNFILAAIIMFLFNYGFAGGKIVQIANSQNQVVGLGQYGYTGGMECPSCTSNSPPQGYYPMFGKVGVYGNTGDGNGDESSKKGIVGSMGSLASKLIDHIPDDNLKSGLQEYMKIVNPGAYQGGDQEVGGHNAGVAKYFSTRFQENNCYQSAAIDFYRDVASTLKKQNSCKADRDPSAADSKKTVQNSGGFCMGFGCPMQNIEIESEYGCFKKRPSIDDHTGVGNKAYLEDGWLLRLALKHSKGNPEAAFELIGMCGHDDVSQGSYIYYDDSETAKQKNADQLSKLKEQKKQLDENLQKTFKKFSSTDEAKDEVYQLGQQGTFLSGQIKMMSMQRDAGRNEYLQCPPQNSDFFLPGSLSSKADISPSLASKVKKIQSTDLKNGHFIPAKYYHVYGSAFLGCKMVEKGMTPVQAATVQKQAARLYRGVRMCQAESGMLQQREQMQKTLGVKNLDDTTEVQGKVTKLWESKLNGEFTCNGMLYSGGPGIKGAKLKNSPIKDSPANNVGKDNMEKCSILWMFDVADLEKGEKQIVSKKINKGLERVDAAKLYNDWYFGGRSIAGAKLPCSDFRYKGPTDLMKPNEGFMGKIFKPTGWSAERYDAASKKLATFDVDFEWTVAQHEAGSSYGAKLCADTKAKKNPFEDKSCLDKKSRPYPYSYGSPGFPTGTTAPGVK
jgi:hypothetical protein